MNSNSLIDTRAANEKLRADRAFLAEVVRHIPMGELRLAVTSDEAFERLIDLMEEA